MENRYDIFTQEDWDEIEAASSIINKPTLTLDDWQHALNECMRVYDCLVAGTYGETDPDCNIEEWTEHMTEIIRKIKDEIIPYLKDSQEPEAVEEKTNLTKQDWERIYAGLSDSVEDLEDRAYDKDRRRDYSDAEIETILQEVSTVKALMNKIGPNGEEILKKEINSQAIIGRLAATVRDLAGLIDDAHDVHIWDPDNDDHPEDGCEYCLATKEAYELLRLIGMEGEPQAPEKAETEKKYWLLVITSENYPIVGVYEDEEEAREKLYSYVKENWENCAVSGEREISGDREDDIDIFFFWWDETYYLEESPIFLNVTLKGGKSE